MRRDVNTRRSSLFLMELMAAILLFSLASAVCIQVFVKAHQVSERAEQLNEAVTLCSDAAELIRAADSAEDAEKLICAELGAGEIQNDTVRAVLDDSNILSVKFVPEAGLCTADIEYLDAEGKSVYSLQLKRFFPGVRK